jgi:hypothetical protein
MARLCARQLRAARGCESAIFIETSFMRMPVRAPLRGQRACIAFWTVTDSNAT